MVEPKSATSSALLNRFYHLAKHIRDGETETPDYNAHSYLGKRVSFEIDGVKCVGVIQEQAPDILFVKSEIAGEAKQFTMPCAECSLLDQEEYAAIAAENKGVLPMAKKDAIAAGKDEECAAADDMGPEMAGDEENAEKNEDEKPEKPKKGAKSKDSKKSKASAMAAKPGKDEDPEDEDNSDDPDDPEDEDDNEADAEEQPEGKAKGPKHTKVTERHQYHEKVTEKKGAKQGPSAEDFKQVATLCQIAGHPELAAGYISDGLSVADVQKKLVDLRAEGSSQHQLSNSVPVVSAKSMDALIAAATEDARRSGKNVAAVVAKAIEANPKAYAEYKRTLPDFRR